MNGDQGSSEGLPGFGDIPGIGAWLPALIIPAALAVVVLVVWDTPVGAILVFLAGALLVVAIATLRRSPERTPGEDRTG
ncbi:hypothetical protein LQ327_05550 [Actinomycetospora endophytica]|uniref:Uncharacterized protein n=1 Tax=Actinomycetospora endophytica TaxID=2291215 RepID=A0ABS8P3M3_9PSEU|nr:hypothetical protein [Actinomycetospora endophytica]MCD2192852.1 hypothetical protein [Actinomycetospora endophytica]